MLVWESEWKKRTMLSCVAKLCFIIQGVFLMVQPRKLRSMKMVPPNSEKMTRFTGSTQNTIKSWLSLKKQWVWDKFRMFLMQQFWWCINFVPVAEWFSQTVLWFYLVIFSLLGGTISILRSFLGGRWWFWPHIQGDRWLQTLLPPGLMFFTNFFAKCIIYI